MVVVVVILEPGKLFFRREMLGEMIDIGFVYGDINGGYMMVV